jgi:hypothetical protein
MPKRIQMSRQKPWRADNPDAVIVSRPSRYGNPYRADGDRAEAVRLFRDMIERAPHDGLGRTIEQIIRGDLGGRDLACWCPLDEPCHADVLLEIANTHSTEVDQ